MQLEQTLSDQEFDELDDFLLSGRCADDAMTMDRLHGFLTALVTGPQPVPITEWLPYVWGSQATPEATPKELRHITSLITRMKNEIAITLEVAPKEYEPLFCEHEHQGKNLLDGSAWADGFWEGMQLRAKDWEPAAHSNLAELLRPIYLLGADEVEEEEIALVDHPLKVHQLSMEMELAIPHLHHYWQTHPLIHPTNGPITA